MIPVHSDFPGLKEVAEGYGLGCTFDPEGPESIVAAVNRVLADERQYDTMRKNALGPAGYLTGRPSLGSYWRFTGG